jgi:hypothetical protein
MDHDIDTAYLTHEQETSPNISGTGPIPIAEPGDPTLADVEMKIARLREQNRLTRKKAGDFLTAITAFANWVEMKTCAIPAVEIAIDVLVDRKSLAGPALGITHRTFTNIVGRVKSAIRVAFTRTSLPSFTRKHNYDINWRPVADELDTLHANGEISSHHRRGIAHLLGYANWAGIAPRSLDSRHVSSLLAYHTQYGSHGQKVKDAVAAWNAIVSLGISKTLPATILEKPNGRRIINPSWDAYPESLKQELDQYTAWMQGLDQVHSTLPVGISAIDANSRREFQAESVSGRKPRRKVVSAAHANIVVTSVRQTAGALVRNGRAPHTIAHLSDLATLEALKASLSDIRLRLTEEGRFDEKAESGYRTQVATTITAMAEEWCGILPSIVAEWRKIVRSVRPRHLGGMSPRRAAQLRKFDDPQYRTAWYTASEQLIARAEKARQSSGIDDEALCDMQTALAIEILQCLPVRGGNIAGIRFRGDPARRNLLLPQRSRDPVWVSWRPEEVKNAEYLKARLSESATRTLRLYLAYYYDAALRMRGIADTDYLFPSSNPKEPKSEKLINASFKSRMKAIGLDMTLHLARHLAAKIVLDRDPSLLPLVSRLLGHKSIETTRRFYCENRTEVASERFKGIVTADAKELKRLEKLHTQRIRRGKRATTPIKKPVSFTNATLRIKDSRNDDTSPPPPKSH